MVIKETFYLRRWAPGFQPIPLMEQLPLNAFRSLSNLLVKSSVKTTESVLMIRESARLSFTNCSHLGVGPGRCASCAHVFLYVLLSCIKLRIKIDQSIDHILILCSRFGNVGQAYCCVSVCPWPFHSSTVIPDTHFAFFEEAPVENSFAAQSWTSDRTRTFFW